MDKSTKLLLKVYEVVVIKFLRGTIKYMIMIIVNGAITYTLTDQTQIFYILEGRGP
jgi:hypothetical protein